MTRTLLLSHAYEPLATISWQDAICKLTLGKVEIIEEYDDQQVRSARMVFKMPAVVRLINAFKRHKKRVKFSKVNVFARDNFKCQYCGTKGTASTLTQDHVVPRSQGGKTVWENIVTCCSDCNAKKANRTPRQARMKLRKQPFRPDWVPIFSVQIRGARIPDQWSPYCGWILK
jgi:5-methylcytosine-specific restriction endonuclease McrA